jgi:hypothetical protein
MRNRNFIVLMENARKIAATAGVNWNIGLDATGVALKGQEWNLRQLTADGRPNTYVLRTFSQFEDAQEQLVAQGLIDASMVGKQPVSEAWQDLIKAYTLDHLVVRNKSIIGRQTPATSSRPGQVPPRCCRA